VTVVDPGAEPRRRLRYTFRAPKTQRSRFAFTVSMSMAGPGGSTDPVTMPKTVLTVSQTVRPGRSPGLLDLTFEIESLDVEDGPDQKPGVAQKLRATLRPLVGLKGQGTMTTRGHLQSFKMDVPAGAGPEVRGQLETVRESLRQMAMPLPEEPVGTGARWHVAGRLEAQGLRLDFKNNFRAVEVAPPRLALEWTVDQSAEPQPLPAQGLPPGARGTLDSLKSTGAGQGLMDLTSLAHRGSARVNTGVASTIEVEGQRMQLHAETALTLEFDRAP
jgi:hypothetical protein